jgi:hypothetical protein
MTTPALTNHQFKIKGNKLWTLTQEYYDELKETYPLHDVEGCMREAKLWCRKVSACKRKTARGMQRFLMGWVSRSEATGHVTVDPERSPSEVIYERNVQDKINDMASVIKEWSDDKLRASPTFQAGWKYPEFRAWVKEQRLNRTPLEPRNQGKDSSSVRVAGYNPPTDKAAVTTGLPDSLLGSQISSDADLPPPPCRADKFNARLKAVREYRDKNPIFI